ncbi:hypothetical protein MPTK1_2g13220 [Marchantia polymorpha subsp. ruderalis]|uniref:Uncharacterized protein n=1 Tax=Marchantia polymorpha TaxID=3197 RepID=A0A2R6XAQ5_MARPO|nr:hypothetical protein MARPO_0026s0050 [Marchantia polymorpha]BBN02152.1 hypothetical protein Mp_2g13220 [Marchantia polymorpha subsp. ruderalis]|eukprot:PTQ43168.1 hypothetical protein MARPO_0026s0050 [Marchantia polymorpha]
MRKIMVSALAILSSARIWIIVERILQKIWWRRLFQRWYSRNVLNFELCPDGGTRSFRSLLTMIPCPWILHSWMRRNQAGMVVFSKSSRGGQRKRIGYFELQRWWRNLVLIHLHSLLYMIVVLLASYMEVYGNYSFHYDFTVLLHLSISVTDPF